MGGEENTSENTGDIAEELKNVAGVINRLSAFSNIDHHKTIDESLSENKTSDENADLRRQIILLEEQVKKKEHSLRILEESIKKERKPISCSRDSGKYCLVNSATQTENPSDRLNLLKNGGTKLYSRFEKKLIFPSHLQSIHPLRSRSSASLKEGEVTIRPASPSTAYSQKKHNNWDSSDFSSSSISSLSSGSHNSPTPIQGSNHREDCSTLMRKYLRKESSSTKLRSRLTELTDPSPHTISSPKQVRSRSSHSPVKRRTDSPARKTYSANRDGWLYTQNSGEYQDRGRQRYCKPTVL